MTTLIIVAVVMGAAFLLGGVITVQSADTPDRSAGFRTALSMKDQESWSFANRFFGRGLAMTGAVGAVLSAVIPVLLLLGSGAGSAAVSAAVMICGECAAFAVLCIITQYRLKKRAAGGDGDEQEKQ